MYDRNVRTEVRFVIVKIFNVQAIGQEMGDRCFEMNCFLFKSDERKM